MKQDFGTLIKSAVRPQLGAMCWRVKDGQLKVLLITSRETGRWVLPKGWPMPGRPDPEAALREAWEEAGVTGTVGEEPIGSYLYDKVLSRATQKELAVRCNVQIYPVAVSSLSKRYPERKQRRRKWFTPARAAELVAEPGLSKLLLRFDPGRA